MSTPVRPCSSYLQLWRHSRPFLVLWVGESVSLIGSGFVICAFSYWLYELTGSTTIMGAYSICLLAAYVLVAPWAGAAADRFDRRLILLLTNLARAALALTPLLTTKPGAVWIAVAGMVALSALGRFFEPAWQAMIPGLVRPTELVTANALVQMGLSVSLIVGPPLGGLAMTLAGAHVAFWLNSLSFLAAAAAVLAVWPAVGSRETSAVREDRGEVRGNDPGAAVERRRPSALRDMRTAWRFIAARRELRILLSVVVASSLTFGTLNVLTAPFMVSVVKASPAGFGTILTAQGLGAVIVAAVVGARPGRFENYAWVGIAVLCLGLSTFLYTTWPLLWLMAALILVEGAVMEMGDIVALTAWQRRTPNDIRGRVFALRSGAGSVAQLLAMAVSAVGADLLGIRPVLFATAGVATVTGLAAIAALRGRPRPIHPEQGRRRGVADGDGAPCVPGEV